MNNKILFVTKGGENCDEGFSYVLELAKTLNTDIELLIIYPGHMMSAFEDIMTAAAFAEAGDFKTMKEVMDSEQEAIRDLVEKKIMGFTERSRETAISLTCHKANGDVATITKDFMKGRPYIDMVLISPSLSESGKTADIKRLLKNISKPIVHISKPLSAEI
ncbi:MAG: hypothetical protein HZA17_08465 [Nitrospirae bacterium]|nr:hypothetical protein [Nitrospirota bacterium]